MSIVLLAAVLALVVTQDKPSVPSSAVPKKGDTIVVRGCIDGGTVASSQSEVSDSTGVYSAPVTYRLTGDKKAIKQIKQEHDGHSDILTGILKSDLPDRNPPRGKTVGNTRITIGMGEQPRSDPRAVQYMPVLQVKGIEHTGTSCR